MNYMTVDFEEWFHGLTSSSRNYDEWANFDSRIDVGADFLLSVFAEYGIRATFFVVGALAERRPDLVRRMAEAGHEIGLHSHLHRRVDDMSPQAFREDICLNKAAIERACSAQPIGFRAPAFSVRTNMTWVWSTLRECGLVYSSSLFPIRTPLYGAPEAPLLPHKREGLVEVPMSVWRFAGQNFPFSGGFYFRALPYALVQELTRAVNRQQRPVVFYFHPWEFDPSHPRPNFITTRERLSHYLGLNGARAKLRRLCADFHFQPLAEGVKRLAEQDASTADAARKTA